MSFSVVEFDDTIEIACIRDEWIINMRQCHYPLSQQVYKKALEHGDAKFAQWRIYNMKILETGIGKKPIINKKYT